MTERLVFFPGWALSRDFYSETWPQLKRCQAVFADYSGCVSPSAILEISRTAAQAQAPCVIAAHSLGCLAAIHTAAKHPGAVKALLLISPTARFTIDPPDYSTGFAPRVLSRMKSRLAVDAPGVLADFAALCLAVDEKELVSRFAANPGWFLPPASPFLTAGLDALAEWDFRPLLKQIDCPVTVISGGRDAVCPPGAAQLIVSGLDQPAAIEYPQAGHLPFLSHNPFSSDFDSFIEQYGG